MFFIGEGTYRWPPGKSDGSTGTGSLPGRFTFGGYYDTGEFETLADNGQTASGLGNAYVTGRQKVWQPGDTESGVDLWSALSYGAQEEIAPVSYFWSGGVIWNGPFPSRADDTLALGAANSWFSSELAGLSHETTLEAAYTYEVNSWLGVTFDLQYILNPGGSGTIDDSVIAGMLLYFTL